jgi:N-acetylglutamate synthase-like GNAT family acetyltransferase
MTLMSTCEVLPLRERPEAIEQLARWHYAQWGHWNPAHNVERRIERFHDHLQSGRIPQTFVAVQGNVLWGSASLIEADLASHSHLSPWLASVYVDSPFRNRGVGTALVKSVEQEARRLGVPRLHLFTPDKAAFYARLGWEAIESTHWGATPVTIMQLNLAHD